LVALGQQIVSTGAFGGGCVVGGTSLAAPHVTAVASVLWQKDQSNWEISGITLEQLMLLIIVPIRQFLTK
jgi:subtilisin family serine protease